MKQTIVRFALKDLDNGTHFEFMTACSTFFTAKTYENEIVNGAIKAFNKALAEEGEQLKLFKTNEEVKNVIANDKRRGNCYTYLRGCIKMHSLAEVSPVKDIAARMLETIDNYKLNINIAHDKETGILRNLIQDLKKEKEFIEAICTMGMKPVFDELERANLAVAAAQDARDRLELQRTTGGMVKARHTTDAAYVYLRNVLESSAIMLGKAFESDIASWNATASRYKANLHLKKSLSAARRKAEATPAPSADILPDEGRTPAEVVDDKGDMTIGCEVEGSATDGGGNQRNETNNDSYYEGDYLLSEIAESFGNEEFSKQPVEAHPTTRLVASHNKQHHPSPMKMPMILATT